MSMYRVEYSYPVVGTIFVEANSVDEAYAEASVCLEERNLSEEAVNEEIGLTDCFVIEKDDIAVVEDDEDDD